MESTQYALSLPTVVWSGIVAAVISLAGVVLSNRSSIERLREQLQHDAREKHRDRLSNLRRDVYLELTSQMMSAQAHLGSLAGLDPTASEFGAPLQSVVAELAKVQLVGSREASAAAGVLTTTYGEALLRLIGAAKPLHELKTDIRIAGDMYDQQYAQAMRILGELNADRESGITNEARTAALNSSFDFHRGRYTHYSEVRDEAWKSYNAKNPGFVKAVLEEAKRISAAQVPLTYAIRTEIGLDTDSSELKRRLEENQARAEKAIDELLAKLDLSGELEDSDVPAA